MVESLMEVVTMSDSARFAPSGNKRSRNDELPLIRPCRIYRRSADRNRLSASAIEQTAEPIAELFTDERGRSAPDNCFAHLRLQFVSVYRRGVLVFDQLARLMAIAHFPEKFAAKRTE